MDHFMQKMEFQLEMPHYPEDYQYVVSALNNEEHIPRVRLQENNNNDPRSDQLKDHRGPRLSSVEANSRIMP